MKGVGGIMNKSKKYIYLASPHMSDEKYEQQYVEEAFRQNWITAAGENVQQFENELTDYIKEGNITAVSSGTAALHLATILSGVDEGDLVFCQSATFIASVNPAVYQKARIVFIDSEPETWNMSPKALEKAIEIYGIPRAVVLVHLYGIPAKIDEICHICEKYNITLIEDAAEALGSEYHGHKCGTFGQFGALSFNGNKIITTSSGGALISKKAEDAEHALKLAKQAREPFPWYEHVETGYNYRLSNICAGIGRGQLKVLDKRIQQKTHIFNMYKEKLQNLPLTFMPSPKGTISNHWLSVALLDLGTKVSVNEIIDRLKEENIESRNFWKPMQMQPLFRECPFVKTEEKAVSEDLFERGICLPSDTKMTDEDIDRICKVIESMW